VAEDYTLASMLTDGE